MLESFANVRTSRPRGRGQRAQRHRHDAQVQARRVRRRARVAWVRGWAPDRRRDHRATSRDLAPARRAAICRRSRGSAPRFAGRPPRILDLDALATILERAHARYFAAPPRHVRPRRPRRGPPPRHPARWGDRAARSAPALLPPSPRARPHHRPRIGGPRPRRSGSTADLYALIREPAVARPSRGSTRSGDTRKPRSSSPSSSAHPKRRSVASSVTQMHLRLAAEIAEARDLRPGSHRATVVDRGRATPRRRPRARLRRLRRRGVPAGEVRPRAEAEKRCASSGPIQPMAGAYAALAVDVAWPVVAARKLALALDRSGHRGRRRDRCPHAHQEGAILAPESAPTVRPAVLAAPRRAVRPEGGGASSWRSAPRTRLAPAVERGPRARARHAPRAPPRSAARSGRASSNDSWRAPTMRCCAPTGWRGAGSHRTDRAAARRDPRRRRRQDRNGLNARLQRGLGSGRCSTVSTRRGAGHQRAHAARMQATSARALRRHRAPGPIRTPVSSRWKPRLQRRFWEFSPLLPRRATALVTALQTALEAAGRRVRVLDPASTCRRCGMVGRRRVHRRRGSRPRRGRRHRPRRGRARVSPSAGATARAHARPLPRRRHARGGEVDRGRGRRLPAQERHRPRARHAGRHQVDVQTLTLRQHDVLMLCSDGVHRVVPLPKLEAILGAGAVQGVAARLEATVVEAGAPDNFSFILASFSAARFGPPNRSRRRPMTRSRLSKRTPRQRRSCADLTTSAPRPCSTRSPCRGDACSWRSGTPARGSSARTARRSRTSSSPPIGSSPRRTATARSPSGRRGKSWRVARIDLVARRAKPWCDARMTAFAPTFDGSSWLVGDGERIFLIDALDDGWRSLWSTREAGATATQIAARGAAASVHWRHGSEGPSEVWIYQDRLLRRRRALEPWAAAAAPFSKRRHRGRRLHQQPLRARAHPRHGLGLAPRPRVIQPETPLVAWAIDGACSASGLCREGGCEVEIGPWTKRTTRDSSPARTSEGGWRAPFAERTRARRRRSRPHPSCGSGRRRARRVAGRLEPQHGSRDRAGEGAVMAFRAAAETSPRLAFMRTVFRARPPNRSRSRFSSSPRPPSMPAPRPELSLRSSSASTRRARARMRIGSAPPSTGSAGRGGRARTRRSPPTCRSPETRATSGC